MKILLPKAKRFALAAGAACMMTALFTAPQQTFAASIETTAEETTEETTAEESTEQETAAALIRQPKLTRVRASGERIFVQWNKVTKASYYLIYRKQGETGTYKRVGKVTKEQKLIFWDSTINPGRTYTYTVKAVGRINNKTVQSTMDRKGMSAYTKIGKVKLDQLTEKKGKIVLTWKQIKGVDGYRCYRKEDSGSFKLMGDIADGSAVKVTDKDVRAGHTYTYTVRAYTLDQGKVRLGAYDSKGLKITAPVTAVSMTSQKVGAGKNLINWTPNDAFSGYIIYRKLGSGKYTKLTTTAIPTRNYYWDLFPKAGKKYSYGVAGYVKIGSKTIIGPMSTLNKSIVSRPATAFITAVRQVGDQDMITWHPVSDTGVDGYKVYYKNSKTGNRWKLASTLDNPKAARVKLNHADNTIYGVRAYVKSGGKTYLSPYTDTLNNLDKNYTETEVLFIGDSITYGYLNLGSGTKVRSTITYPERVSCLTGIQYYNASNSGSTLAWYAASLENSQIRRIQEGKIDLKDRDVIFVALGTNDYERGVKMGTETDSSVRSFNGSLNALFAKVQEDNPEAKVVLMTPLYRNRSNSNYSKRGYDVPNSKGLTLGDYCDAIVSAANRNGAYVYDSRKMNLVNADNSETFLGDGLHPTVEGYTTMAKSISAYLIKYVMSADGSEKETPSN